jgi:hypothetical protein
LSNYLNTGAILSGVIDDREPVTVSMGQDKELVIMDA